MKHITKKSANKTFTIFTLGCKVNQYESQSIRELFLRAGFKELTDEKRAKYTIINTCTVTASADRKSRYTIRHCIRENPLGKILVTGCMARKDEKSLSGIRDIDLVIGKRFFKDGINGFEGRTRAFLKIQDGCNNRCSYCIVPLARGPSRSREMKTIVAEASVLAAKGFKEIVLTGICLGAYGRDMKPRTTLAGLIEKIEPIPGLERLRLSSIEASDVSDELIEIMAYSRKLCPHLHIPIQSGDDTILRRMGRTYRRADYLNIITRIKKKIPGIAVTTDILVGFPGETDERFKNTVALIEKIAPLRAHIFPYSPRPGTPAYTCPDTIEEGIIQKRICALRKTAERCSQEFQSRFIRKQLDVLFECPTGKKPGIWEGYAGNYIKVMAPAHTNVEGKILPVLLTAVQNSCMRGRIIN